MPPAAAGFVTLLRRLTRPGLRRGLAVVAACALGAAVANHAIEVWRPPGPSLAEQVEVAHKLVTVGAPLRSAGPALDLEFEALGDFTLVEGSGGDVLVMGSAVNWLHPEVIRASRPHCRSILYESPNYLVCFVDPTPS